jgi:hypothetical protein
MAIHFDILKKRKIFGKTQVSRTQISYFINISSMKKINKQKEPDVVA